MENFNKKFKKIEKNNISVYNKTMIDIDNFKKFPIGKDKAPLVAWRNNSNLSKGDELIRSGIPCGEINNIVVVDIDDYDMKEDNPFIKKFGKDYASKFDTFIVKTTSGGKHIYFQYDKELDKTAHNNDISIDFQSNGAYVVSPKSDCYTKAEKHLPVYQRTTRKYKIIKNNPISKMPIELKEFIIKELILKDKKHKKQLIKKNHHQKVKANAITPYYNYNINESDAEVIANGIDAKLYQNYNSWWKLLHAFKEMGFKDIFLKYSIIKAPFYKGQEENNEKLYDSIKSFGEFNLIWLLKEYYGEDGEDFTRTKDFINNYKCKDIYKNPTQYKPNEIINVEKLGFGMKLEFNKDYIIKADTGTGKTTITKEFLRTINPQYRFISITARISLATEQYRVFRNADLSCKYYEDVKDDYFNLKDTDSLCICVNSINMIGRQDFSNTIVFLDEYNSLIEDVFTSPTMKNRIDILETLLKMIASCKMVIAVDADIQDHTLEILKFCKRTPHYIKNEYLHNKGNTAKEWDSVDEMMQDIKTKDAWLLCSDSKTTAKTIFQKLAIGDEIPLTDKEKKKVKGLEYYKDEKGIMVCITAESILSTRFSIDDFERVIFSPKIIYGLDGSISRDVYCIYEEQTISPRAMNQQVNRCRNINSLNYVFLKNLFTNEQHVEMTDIYETIEKTNEYTLFENYANENVLQLYKKVASIIQYNNDSFNTNKKAHFVERLKTAGWNVVVSITPKANRDNKSFKEDKKIMKDNEYENFDEFYKKHKDHIDKTNEYFSIPKDKIDKYKHLFLGSQKTRDENLNIGRFLFKSHTELINELKEQKEFNDKKFKNNKFKVAFLQQFMIECGAENKFNFKIGENNQFTDKEWNKVSEATKKKYELMFKPTEKMMESKHNPIIKMMNDLFGSSVCDDWSIKKDKENSTPLFIENNTRINGKKIRIKECINPDFVKNHTNIIKYRYEKDFIKGNINLNFGEEDKNFVEEKFENCMIKE